MQSDEFKITSEKTPLKLSVWDNSFYFTILFVGGSGDTREKLKPLIEKLIDLGLKYNFISFSFRGVEENQLQPLKNQIDDLKEILSWTTKKQYKNLIIVCTSMGAYSTTNILVDSNTSQSIKKVIFIDPADYYIRSDDKIDGGGTWSGNESYDPIDNTASTILKNINSNVIVDVINFTIRNYMKNGYELPEKRHIDNPTNVERLNNLMVKSFYNNTPSRNRGDYIENNTLPHAFLRDGNIENNLNILGGILAKLLKKNE